MEWRGVRRLRAVTFVFGRVVIRWLGAATLPERSARAAERRRVDRRGRTPIGGVGRTAALFGRRGVGGCHRRGAALPARIS